jgi:RNA recognition motif-containing protein
MTDYKTIPIRFVDSTNNKEFIHYLYIKQHFSKRTEDQNPNSTESKENESFPPDRTLFLANLPFAFGEKELGKLFSRCGGVESVTINGLKERQEVLLTSFSP